MSARAMDIKCESCGVEYELQDERVAAMSRRFHVKCDNCGSIWAVDKPDDAGPTLSAAAEDEQTAEETEEAARPQAAHGAPASELSAIEQELLDQPGLAEERVEYLAVRVAQLLRSLARRRAAGTYDPRAGAIDSRRTANELLRTMGQQLSIYRRQRQRVRNVLLLLDVSESADQYQAFQAVFAALAFRLLPDQPSVWSFGGKQPLRVRPAATPTGIRTQLAKSAGRPRAGSGMVGEALAHIGQHEQVSAGHHLMVLSDFFASFTQPASPPPPLPPRTVVWLRQLRSIRLFDLVPRLPVPQLPGLYDADSDRFLVPNEDVEILFEALEKPLPTSWGSPETGYEQELSAWQLKGLEPKKLVLSSPHRTLRCFTQAGLRNLRIVDRSAHERGRPPSLIKELFYDAQQRHTQKRAQRTA